MRRKINKKIITLQNLKATTSEVVHLNVLGTYQIAIDGTFTPL